MIEESDCGFAVPPDDPEAFADALIDVSDDRQVLLQKGANAEELAKAEFARAELSNHWVQWVTGTASTDLVP